MSGLPEIRRVLGLTEVRQALAQRFPPPASSTARSWTTGWDLLDLHGGLGRGATTELISAAGCGGLFLDRLLAATEKAGSFAALIDASHSFDPNSYLREKLRRLLYVFTETPEKAVKAADLLLRDGNLPLVLLDFQLISRRNLARIPASTWHRFQRLVEKSGIAFVVLTTQPMIEAARVRLVMRNSWNLAALPQRRRNLVKEIELQVFDRRRGGIIPPKTLLQTA